MIVDTTQKSNMLYSDDRDSDAYAYGPVGTSFVSVLNQVNATTPNNGATAPNTVERLQPEREAADDAAAPAEETADSTRDHDGTTEETEAAGEPEAKSGSTSSGAPAAPHGANTTGDTAAGDSTAGEALPQTADLAGVEVPDPLIPTALTDEAAPEITQAALPVQTATGPQAPFMNFATGDAPEDAPDTPFLSLSNAVSGTSGQDALGIDGGKLETPFPKTLNALLAEKAVDAGGNHGDRVRLAAARVLAAAPEKSAAGDGDPLPGDQMSLPQTAATESGGVRLSAAATMPRIPLTNLPGEIAQQIHLLQQQGDSTMKLRLVPEHLGELRLEVHRIGDTVRVTMISNNAHVRDALHSQVADLRQALEQQGLSLAEASVEDGQASRDFEAHTGRRGGSPATPSTDETTPGEGSSSLLHGTPAEINTLSGGLNVLA